MPFFNNKVKDIIEIVYESKSVEEIFGRNIWKKYLEEIFGRNIL